MSHEGMKPEEVARAQRELGLSTEAFAQALGLGPSGGRTVRRWKSGARKVSGPTARLIRMLLESRKTEGVQ